LGAFRVFELNILHEDGHSSIPPLVPNTVIITRVEINCTLQKVYICACSTR